MILRYFLKILLLLLQSQLFLRLRSGGRPHGGHGGFGGQVSRVRRAAGAPAATEEHCVGGGDGRAEGNARAKVPADYRIRLFPLPPAAQRPQVSFRPASKLREIGVMDL